MSAILKKTVRQGDDFKVIITLIDRNGVPLDAKKTEFRFVYKDIYGNSYEISRIGETHLNNYIDGDHVVGVFEKYQLANCILKREEWYRVADDAFSDGRWDYGNTRPSNIELTRDGGAKEVEETVDIPDPIYVNETLVVSKGDPFRYDDFTTAQLNALKGETGNSGVYVGATPPTDGSVSIALDPSGDAYGEIPMGGKVGEVLTKTTAADYAMAWSSPLRPLFVARGAVWNANTGFYELNGLTDITEEQMIDIYNLSAGGFGSDATAMYAANASVRTVFESLSTYGGLGINARNMFASNALIETVAMPKNVLTVSWNMFYNCASLRCAIASMLYVNKDVDANAMFYKCVNLKHVQIRYLHVSVSFSDSPNLTRDSILYLINNAANATPITVTLHADAKTRLTEADIALASSKNITIA